MSHDIHILRHSVFYHVQSFILTFLAEWGDRSQIATIAVRNFFFHLVLAYVYIIFNLFVERLLH